MAQRPGPEAGSCEQGNEHSSSINRREFLNRLGERWLLNKDSAPCSSKNTSPLMEQFMEGVGWG